MSKGNKVLGFIVAIVVLGVATFGGVYFALSKGEGAGKVMVVEEAFHEVGEIFVNLDDDKAKRYVKLNLSVGFNKANKDLGVEVLDKQVVMRANSISYIRSLKAVDFEPTNEEKLKKDIIERLNQKLTKGEILEVYISDIILQ